MSVINRVYFLLFCWHFIRINAQSCSLEGAIRIVNTTSFDDDFAGRVEVCYSGVWGTIGTNGGTLWHEKNAQVACRAAGFDGAINSIYTSGLAFGDRAEGTIPVHFTVTSCTGSETSLLNCTLNTDVSGFMFPQNTYNHDLDAFVVCRPKSESYSTVHPAGTQVGDFRLIGDPSNGRGAVEIYTSQFRWVSICTDGFSDSDAAALCGRLGYAGGRASQYSVSAGSIGSLYLHDADCTESGLNVGLVTTRIIAGVCSFESSIQGCPSGSTLHAGVECFGSSVALGSIRLFGGSASSGVLETYYDGKWGMVCRGSSFGENEARAVCGELGYYQPHSEHSNADSSLLQTESNLKPIWLSDVQCPEGASRFSECSLSGQTVGYAPCRNFPAVSCRPRLSGGEIAGIVIGIPAGLIIIFIIAWFAGLNKHWANRRNNRHYQAMASCCSACKQRARNLRVQTAPRRQPEAHRQPEAGIQIEETTATTSEPVHREPEPSEPPPTMPESEREFTKSAPPQYSAAIGFQGIAADLPPPYTETTFPH